MEFGITLRASLPKESMTQGATDSAPAAAGAAIPVCGYGGFAPPNGLAAGAGTGERASDGGDPRPRVGAKAQVRRPGKQSEDVGYRAEKARHCTHGQPVGWVVAEGKKTERTVKLGEENEADVIVTEGLDGGERVVLR